MSIPLYFTQHMKNGKWRLKKIVGQALMSWKGDNDKITTVRTPEGLILNFDSKEVAQKYCQDIFKAKALDESEVDK